MSVPCYLGDLKYLRIWHDNSGKGRFASWYLQYILVRNVQTGEMTTFVCNEWLAVEYDDGLIDRLIPVAGKEQMRDFATVFPHQSQQSLSDGHLWFSVFLRPPRSRFTRMQRVSCCFALLFLSMMVNAMWYERVPSKPSAGSIKFGPLSLSPEQIALLDDLYGYIIGIIVFIATLKFIKLLRFNRRIGMLSATLKQTWNDLTGFFAIFTIAIGSFGLLFNLLLVAYMDDFKDFLSAVESCFAMMLNKFEFMEMYRSSFLAAMMFFLFAIYMNIIFVNREEQESKDVRQLPDKVSTFIDQINHTYFDGKLDLNDKKMLKKTLRQAKHEQRGRPKSMEGFQRDDDHMTVDQKHLDEL
ncbi:Polycystic kidney disease protein 1-like 2 [Amphibalanus amphitrite]|uniref:Polycystic kidney disease protein 1-like 2 n=1 Tax=Amphibalanus amphitrite TaxID=1232801 RepID=A0A6A4XCA5_AMPAM|nr:Polycystic kidney disease protein 1-like 2 [Amphibalanus amphitrite]